MQERERRGLAAAAQRMCEERSDAATWLSGAATPHAVVSATAAKKEALVRLIRLRAIVLPRNLGLWACPGPKCAMPLAAHTLGYPWAVRNFGLSKYMFWNQNHILIP